MNERSHRTRNSPARAYANLAATSPADPSLGNLLLLRPTRPCTPLRREILTPPRSQGMKKMQKLSHL